MNDIIFPVFLYNVVAVAIIFSLFGRKIEVPLTSQIVLFCSVVTSPFYVAMKGTMSAIYLTDAISPFLLLTAFFQIRKVQRNNRFQFFLYAALLFWFPLLATGCNFALYGSSFEQFTSRNLTGLSVWLYRNVIFMSALVIGLAQSCSINAYKEHIKLAQILCIGVAILGALDYSGLRELSVYEMLAAYNDQDFSFQYSNTTLGWGFLGMFRGSVGQFFSNLFIISLGVILGSKGIWRVVGIVLAISSMGFVLCSLSRAGLVGLVTGAFLLMLALGFRGVKVGLAFLVFSLVFTPLLQLDVIQDRLDSIGTYTGQKHANRVDGWIAAMNVFASNTSILLIGNGATNRDGVAKLIGAFGAHNEYIDSIFRMGLLGLMCLILIVLSQCGSLYRNTRLKFIEKSDRVWVSVPFAVFGSNVVIGFTQDHLLRDYSGYSSGLFMYFFYGLSLGISSGFRSISMRMDGKGRASVTPSNSGTEHEQPLRRGLI